MPFDFTKHADFTYVRLYGVLTPADLARFAEACELVESSSPRGRDRVTDLTSVEEFDLGFPAVLALAEARKRRALPNPVKCALIAREPVQVGFARMFQSVSDRPNVEVRILRSVGEALEWFGDKSTRSGLAAGDGDPSHGGVVRGAAD